MDEDTPQAEPTPPAPEPDQIPEPSRTAGLVPAPAPAPNAGMWPWLALGLLVLGGLIITNILLLDRVSDLETELGSAIATIDDEVSDLATSVGDVSTMVDEVEAQLGTINALALASSGNSSTAPQPTTTAVGAGLPRYDETIADPALGVQIAGMEGPEYYTGQTLSIDAADGTARAWIVWAHWCPFCQQELPELKAWVEANAADFPNFELVSLTTAMDESRGNPLVPYLDGLELPFPVIVDADGSLSNQLGLNAFPFWVFTGPDGTVLGRSAGAMGTDRFASVFQQLQDIASA